MNLEAKQYKEKFYNLLSPASQAEPTRKEMSLDEQQHGERGN